jgi:hypothetical protein
MTKLIRNFIIFIAALSVSFTSCKKNEPKVDALLGTWTISEKKVDITSTNLLLNQLLSPMNFGEAIPLPTNLTFNENGTGTYNTTETFTYTKTATQITFKNFVLNGISLGDEQIADYQLLDSGKTLALSMTVTEEAKPLLQESMDLYYTTMASADQKMAIDMLGGVDGIVDSITKIVVRATYKK